MLKIILNSQSRAGSAIKYWQRLRENWSVGHYEIYEHENFNEIPIAFGDKLVAAGGDGTLNQLINNVIARVGLENVSGFTFGHIGLGSNNSYLKPFSGCQIIGGSPVKLSSENESHDLGRVIYRDLSGSLQTRYFIANASFGVLAHANQIFSNDRMIRFFKKVSIKVADALSFLKALKNFSAPEIYFSTDGVFRELTCITNLNVIKHPYFAGDFHVCEKPELSDGMFHYYVLPKKSKLDILRAFVKMSLGQDVMGKGIPTDSIIVKCQKPICFEFDGEVVEGTEFHLSCLQGAIRVCQ
ncbi:MAG: hypothetical protein A4S09_13850 [Proteobacteria bacterium SG_bin7]|nr:MAG: hypothetical protein A4S09_13850 [Proteobacteria bacterium SG_bin7]